MSSRRILASLFLVSLFGLSFETFLSRFFALALFSDYSYWVISLALLGYSFGGVLLTLARDHFHRNHELYLFLIPPLLLAAAILAFALLRGNPFNPLQLQNEVLWKSQIGNIFLYYAGLFPVFFLTGTYIGLVFLISSNEMPKVYAVDLLGAACGAAVILAAMFLLHPYHLPAVMLPILFAVVIALERRHPREERHAPRRHRRHGRVGGAAGIRPLPRAVHQHVLGAGFQEAALRARHQGSARDRLPGLPGRLVARRWMTTPSSTT